MAGRLGGWARYGLPGVALGLLMSWGAGFHGEPAAARAQGVAGRGTPAGARPAPAARAVPAGEAGGILALIDSSGAPGVQGLYLIDTKKRSLAIYRVDLGQGGIKLAAARQFRWDLELDDYNNQGLEPADVKARVEALNRSNP